MGVCDRKGVGVKGIQINERKKESPATLSSCSALTRAVSTRPLHECDGIPKQRNVEKASHTYLGDQPRKAVLERENFFARELVRQLRRGACGPS